MTTEEGGVQDDVGVQIMVWMEVWADVGNIYWTRTSLWSVKGQLEHNVRF